jgi:maltodextrin utilization protein YvdJ
MLSNFGFDEGSAVIALSEMAEDIDAAAEALLQGRVRSRTLDGDIVQHKQQSQNQVLLQPDVEQNQLQEQEQQQVQTRQEPATVASQSSRHARGRWRAKQQES